MKTKTPPIEAFDLRLALRKRGAWLSLEDCADILYEMELSAGARKAGLTLLAIFGETPKQSRDRE